MMYYDGMIHVKEVELYSPTIQVSVNLIGDFTNNTYVSEINMNNCEIILKRNNTA